MSDLQQLKRFIEQSHSKNDAQIRSILSSGSKSIFPKHELSKIEISKNKVNKLRLVMQNITTFLSLQIYAKNLDNITKTTPSKELKRELDQLQKDLGTCKTSNLSNDYDFQILESKGKVQQLCRELSRQKVRSDLKKLLQKNPKWKNYLQANLKEPQQYDFILNERDKANLAFTIDLGKVQDCLLTGTSGKIIEQRYIDEVIKHRLRQVFASEDYSLSFPSETDPFQRQWEQTSTLLQGQGWV